MKYLLSAFLIIFTLNTLFAETVFDEISIGDGFWLKSMRVDFETIKSEKTIYTLSGSVLGSETQVDRVKSHTIYCIILEDIVTDFPELKGKERIGIVVDRWIGGIPKLTSENPFKRNTKIDYKFIGITAEGTIIGKFNSIENQAKSLPQQGGVADP